LAREDQQRSIYLPNEQGAKTGVGAERA
jgi:hypothetical protein